MYEREREREREKGLPPNTCNELLNVVLGTFLLKVKVLNKKSFPQKKKR